MGKKLRYLTLTLTVGLVSIISMAQEKKLFTLEDINYGGTNYWNMMPANRYTTWWGDELIHTDIDRCNVIDKKTGNETLLFTLEEIQGITGSDKHNKMRHLYNCSFPYPAKTIVKLINGQELLLVDWEKKQLVARYDRNNVQAEEWNSNSQAFASTRDYSGVLTATVWHSIEWTSRWLPTIRKLISTHVYSNIPLTNILWQVRPHTRLPLVCLT